MEAKYYLAGVDVAKRQELKCNYDYKKAYELFWSFNIEKDTYTLIHDTHTERVITVAVDGPVIEFRPVEGYNVMDWYYIVQHAKQVICIDSALSNFIEGVPEFRHLNKTIHLTAREPNIICGLRIGMVGILFNFAVMKLTDILPQNLILI